MSEQSGDVGPGAPRDRARWGVVCLANDAVLEWARALFASLRRYAPRLPVIVIPYDDRQSELSRVVARYGHAYFESAEIDRFHRLGLRFYPDDEFAARGFRKLAAFSGPFDHFFSLDTDVLLLSELDDLCAAVERAALDLVHFDTDTQQVYRQGGPLERLSADGLFPGFNAGLFVGRFGTLDAERMENALGDLDQGWRESLVPNAEQPFLNLAAGRLGLRMRAAHELASDFCSTCWPAVGRIEPDGAVWRLRGSKRWDEGWRFRFVHWAGFKLGLDMPNRALWEAFRAEDD